MFNLNIPKYCFNIKELIFKNGFKLYAVPTLKELFESNAYISYKDTFISGYEILTNEIWQNLLVELINNKYYFKCQLEEEKDDKVLFQFSLCCLIKINKLAFKYFPTISRIEAKDGEFVSATETTVENYDIPTFNEDGEQSEDKIATKSISKIKGRENILNLEKEYFNKISNLKNEMINEIISDKEYFIKENFVELFGKI